MKQPQHHGPRSPRVCPDCRQPIEPGGDDAGVCIQCGGQNARIYRGFWAAFWHGFTFRWVRELIERA